MVVTRLYFEIPDNNGADTEYTIDLARELSKHHRRLVRQKQIFTVYGGIYQDTGTGGTPTNAYFSTAPHYWVTKRAINRGFSVWRKQISAAMSNSGEQSGKWSDFKIYLDDNGSTNQLACKDAGGTDLPSGEWNYTTLTMPRPDLDANGDGSMYTNLPSDQFELFIAGAHVSSGSGSALNYTRVGLIKSWLDSRPNILADATDQPDDQDTVTMSDPLVKMFMTGDSDEDSKIIETIQDENDFPPYDADVLYGAVGTAGAEMDLQLQCIVSPDSNSGVAAVAGFQAICGLVRIFVSGDTGSNGASLILDVESNGVGF